MALKRIRHTVNTPAEIEPLIRTRMREEKYRSISDYFVSLAVFDIYARRKHILTAQLMNEPREIQDKVFSDLRTNFDNPRTRPGSSWFEHRIEELLKEKRVLARVVTDPHGRITEANRQFTQMCGYSLRYLRGKKPGEVLQGPATERDVVRDFRGAIQKQMPFECTLTNYHKNGSIYRVHIKMSPIFKERELVGFEAVERRMQELLQERTK